MVTLAALIVRLSAWLASAEWRDRWREEWLAEIDRAAGGGRPAASVLARAAGAPVDALTLRMTTGRGLMDTLRQDITAGLRQIRRQRAVSLVAIATLALGIGASTAIFTVIDAALLRPLPYPEPERLVTIAVDVLRAGSDTPSAVPPSVDDLRRWQSAGDVFSVVAGWMPVSQGLVVKRPAAERVDARQITEAYLSLHGVAPILGRDLNLTDLAPGAPDVALISHGYWQRRFGGSADAVGQVIQFSEGAATIVGVLPATFSDGVSIFRPLTADPRWDTRRGLRPLTVYARLQPGVSVEDAAERLTARLDEPVSPAARVRTVGIRVTSRLDATVGDYQTTVGVLAAAVALVLVIACVNVAGLLLARGASRTGELAVRASLGATRGRMVRQLLTESVVLSSVGGVVGVIVAWISLDVLVANIPMALPSDAPASLNLTVLGAAAALSVATGILFGAAPALRLSGVQLSSALARGGRGHDAALSRRGGQWLIGFEVALAVVLVAGAGLMLRSFSRLAAVDLGFDASGFVTMEVSPLDPNPEVHQQYYPALLETIRAMPDVVAAGAADWFAMDAGALFSVMTVNGEKVGLGTRGVLPGYFDALGLPLRSGQLPTAADHAAGLPVAVVNEFAARKLFPEGSAVGGAIISADTTYRIVGVVGDLRHGGPANEPSDEVYLPFRAGPSNVERPLVVVVRPTGRGRELASRLRRAAESVGPGVLVERIRTGDEWFADRVATPRQRMVLLGLLGGLGLVLALVGVFGMTAFAVARRTREIGVRMTFGARPGQVVAEMIRDAAWPVAAGTAAGLAAAFLATQVIATFLFETTPTDPATFAAVAATLLATGGLAAWLPARRAARVDPVSALRV